MIQTSHCFAHPLKTATKRINKKRPFALSCLARQQNAAHLFLLLLSLLAFCATASENPALQFVTTPGDFIAPESHSGTRSGLPARSEGSRYMAVTANRHATAAASNILAKGGSAIDAAIAAQMVLGLTEPQSSGIGGGAFLLYFDASQKKLHYYDGRETAPHNINASHFLAGNEAMPFLDAVVGGHATGVPGVLRMLEYAHRQHGKMPWQPLFDPAIHLARSGFEVSQRLNYLLENLPQANTPNAFTQYFFRNGQALEVGSLLKNPDYANTLQLIADHGVEVFYTGEIAKNIVNTLQASGHKKSSMTLQDLENYKSLERAPLCMDYREFRVCGASPPSSGGSTVLSILGILENFPLASMNEDIFIHHFIEASRLAFADRNAYIADPTDMPVPVELLISKPYLQTRASLINPARKTAIPGPGQPGAEPLVVNEGINPELPSTTQLSIIDSYGNALSMTSSIETAFGSRVMVNGFLLNNQLTDFSFLPTDDHGGLIANRPAPGKRPRSSMSPTMVFRKDGSPYLITGSPGGARIIDYTALHLTRVIDRHIDPYEAMQLPHVIAIKDTVELEFSSTPYSASLLSALIKMQHKPLIRAQSSGLNVIRVQHQVYTGYSDPRREGLALGE
ncbi:MAG: gamma-glutamyltransferase [Pseudomonadales bacterium]|nr:gamma-glutamyltransferase [Pseudomonadales bacterium]